MRLLGIFFFVSLTYICANAAEFLDYKKLGAQLKKENKKTGNLASTQEVKQALQSKDWIVADVRTMKEWSAGHIKGAVRIGRQSPEKALGSYVLDNKKKFIKDKLIVVCNSAGRASIEAQTFRKMGFTTVKVYDLYSWIDECNPVDTNYTTKKDKKGLNVEFGPYYAKHCYKK